MNKNLHLLILFFLFSCNADELAEKINYETLPENIVAVDEFGIKAQYINPVTYYTHGILGDAIEGGGLLVELNNIQYVYLLDSTQVFEDIYPRLVDIDNDELSEIVTILTNVERGASVAIFKVENGKLILHAQSEYIGRPSRWLNIAAIEDFDKDEIFEICWVSTPHIGGTLIVAHVENNKIVHVDSQKGLSNHKIRSGNLNLSLITRFKKQKTLYVPNDDFDKLIGFQWKNNKIIAVDTIVKKVDPLVPLYNQITLP